MNTIQTNPNVVLNHFKVYWAHLRWIKKEAYLKIESHKLSFSKIFIFFFRTFSLSLKMVPLERSRRPISKMVSFDFYKLFLRILEHFQFCVNKAFWHHFVIHYDTFSDLGVVSRQKYVKQFCELHCCLNHSQIWFIGTIWISRFRKI